MGSRRLARLVGSAMLSGALLFGVCAQTGASEVTDIGTIDYGELQHSAQFSAAEAALQNAKAGLDADFSRRMSQAHNDDQRRAIQADAQAKWSDARKAALGPLIDRLHVAVASIASSKNLSVVLDKSIVIVGGLDVTHDVTTLLAGPAAPVAPVSTPPPSTVGFVDETQINANPVIKASNDQMDAFRKQNADTLATALRGAKSADDRTKIIAQNTDVVNAEEQKIVEPVAQRTRDAIAKVADARRLQLVVDKAAVVYGGADVTGDVGRSFAMICDYKPTRRQRLLTAAALCWCFAGCSHSDSTANTSSSPSPSASVSASGSPTNIPPTNGAPTNAASGKVGFVRTRDLVRADPLFGRLTTLDAQMTALADAGAGVDSAAAAKKEQANLNQQLQQSARDSQTALHARGVELEREENVAIDTLLREQTHGSDITAMRTAIAQSIADEQHSVSAQAASENERFIARSAQIDDQTLRTMRNGLSARALDALNARAQTLSEAEAKSALDRHRADASARLELRARRDDLKIDAATRAKTDAQLQALDRSESDAEHAQRTRDIAELNTLHTQLARNAATDSAAAANDIGAANAQKNGARAGVASVQQSASIPLPAAAASPMAVDPALRAKIAAIHNDFQARFDKEAAASAAAFKAQHDTLQARFDQFEKAAGSANGETAHELDRMRAERQQVFSEILDHIRQATNKAAAAGGVAVVVADPAGGGSQSVDLTEAVRVIVARGGA